MATKEQFAFWSIPENIERLKTLWADNGLTTEQIGRKMGIRKNQVIGKARRLKLEPRKSGNPNGNPRKNRKPRYQPVPQVLKQPVANPVSYAAREVEAPSQPCSLLELTETRCKWPIGHPKQDDFHFCGANKPKNGRPYCLSHEELAWAK
jgi:GcrA cell cycle regulator